MRIIIVTTSYPSAEDDASGHFVETEARALAREGHEVIVLTPGAPGRSFERGVIVERLPHGGAFGAPGALYRISEKPQRLRGAWQFVRGARAFLRNEPCDRVVAHWILPSGWPIATASAAPLEVVAHGSDVRLLRLLPRPLRALILRNLLKRGARFRFVSSELRNLVADAGAAELYARAHVAPSPIDVSSAPDREHARAERRIDPRERLIVIVGRLVTSKRTATALSAVGLLPRARVVVVGSGPERAALEKRFPEAQFVGHLPRAQALGWIAAADLLVSASRHEGAPTVVREARALGIPVVSTSSSDLHEWARSDRDLFVV
ncbi:MAG TPA: glycosyltransferase [Polyangiaceae bacterium]|nr:glycosyltransferase [Polyangiaceae bacterium]